MIRRALVSVADKTGIVPFADALVARGVALISTGGTARTLTAAGLPVTEVATVTGFPEMLDGRVKTLHPSIHAGLLARRDRPDDLAALAERGIAPIDLVVCNLYPFAQTVASGADAADCMESIDIGGVALIRAAAKNHDAVTVVVDTGDYDAMLAEVTAHGGAVGSAMRQALARKAYALTSAYDAAVAEWMAREGGVVFPETTVFAGRLAQQLRYGENPHQAAAFYRTGEARLGVATARQLQGKELSYNNYGDADAAFELVTEFAAPAVAIVKHANPCGVAIGETLYEAWDKALACDPVSAYGGVVALNRGLDAATAEAIGRLFIEVVIAPNVTEEAVAILRRRKAQRLMVTGGVPDPAAPGKDFRSVSGGILVQDRDRLSIGREALRSVTRRAPSEAEIGQAAETPQPPTIGSVLASDAVFPFADGVEAAIEAGVAAIIQPGGSIRDADVIAAADAAGIAMVFTGMRHFRH